MVAFLPQYTPIPCTKKSASRSSAGEVFDVRHRTFSLAELPCYPRELFRSSAIHPTAASRGFQSLTPSHHAAQAVAREVPSAGKPGPVPAAGKPRCNEPDTQLTKSEGANL
jgi:hypothetical protein